MRRRQGTSAGQCIFARPKRNDAVNGSNTKKASSNELAFVKCRLQESNQGHKDFQSFALPTELKRRTRECITQIGFNCQVAIGKICFKRYSLAMENYQAALNYETLVMALGKADTFCINVFDEIAKRCDIDEPFPYNKAVYSEVAAISENLLEEAYIKCRSSFERMPKNVEIIDPKSSVWPKAATGVRFLYLLGNKELLNTTGISVVGTRSPSNQGKTLTQEVVKALGESGFTIVSGLALGVDGIAHIAALAGNFSTIGVIGTSVCEVYPKEHVKLQAFVAEHGLVVSQFAPSRQVQRYFFMQRNQLMSQISQGSFVIEDRDGGGAVQQAQYSQKQGKKVFVLKEVAENRTFLWPRKFEDAVIVPNVSSAGKAVKRALCDKTDASSKPKAKVSSRTSKKLDPAVQPELF